MRRLRFFLIGLAVFAASCAEKEPAHNQSEGTLGELIVTLSTDAHTGDMTTKSGSENDEPETVPAELVPELEAFKVDLYTESHVRLYHNTYENTIDKVFRLNTGNYRLVAQHGDSLGCGFNKPYFLADHQIQLTPADPVQTVEATARLANVQMAVSYDETITGTYDDYYVVVRHCAFDKKSVKFLKDETRYGYIPAGDMVIEFYAYVSSTEGWKYSRTEVRTFLPNDFLKIRISSPRNGEAYFNLSVDGNETIIEEAVLVPDYAAPQDAPALTLAGFDEYNKCRVIEGVDVGAGGSVSMLARAGIAECYLTVESDILYRKGLSAGEYDLINADAATVEKLHAAGIYWDENMLGTRVLSFVNLAETVSILNAETKSSTMEQTVATFTLKVVDEVGAEGSVDFSVVSVPINPVLEIFAHNVWATKVLAPTISISEGANKKLFKLQMSTDNIRWTSLENEIDGTGTTMTAEDITGLQPDHTYYFRVIYNDNPLVVSGTKTVKTEAALQIGNNEFEEFIIEQFAYKSNTLGTGGDTYYRNWYLPWRSGETDKWWAVNSRKTLPTQTTSGDHNYKIFPTVTYSQTLNNKHAQIATVYISNLATDTEDKYELGSTLVTEIKAKAVGEIFLGEAADDGTAKSLGHVFTSRPTSLSFDYVYTPMNNEKFYARIDLLDINGNIIAEAEINKSDAGAVDRWTTRTLKLNYKTMDVNAAKIRLAFRSTTNSDADAAYASNSGVTIQIAGSSETARLGSILLIDNVILNYE